MAGRVAWLLAIAAVVFIAFRAFQSFFIQLEVQQTEEEVPIEEQILLDKDLFYEDFGKKKVIHLRTFAVGEVPHFDGVTEPRPKLSFIKERYGEPDRVGTEDMSDYGIRRDVIVYSYGRLGLGMPANLEEGKVFWVLLR